MTQGFTPNFSKCPFVDFNRGILSEWPSPYTQCLKVSTVGAHNQQSLTIDQGRCCRMKISFTVG